ncbi:MAG: LD-carboxypeptidase [Candidatus Pacebacteria bacterium]|nr:LD-carboxypeptidase [Candidatus Paceibacterota bacterium]
MKKVALVNLSTYEDISNWPSYDQDIDFLKNNNIPFVDYAANFSSKNDLLKNFNKALNDQDVQCIWFVCGGNKIIESVNLLDWEQIKNSQKVFIGLSDFTHFSLLASVHGLESYYGLALKKISKYYDAESQKRVAGFLISVLEEKKEKLDYVYSKDSEPVIGGHLIATIFMINKFSISLKGKHLFIEHHNFIGETLDDLVYYVNQLCLTLEKNKPLSIVLGHSISFDSEGKEIDYKIVNSKISNLIGDCLTIPVSEVDHFSRIIKFN